MPPLIGAKIRKKSEKVRKHIVSILIDVKIQLKCNHTKYYPVNFCLALEGIIIMNELALNYINYLKHREPLTLIFL